MFAPASVRVKNVYQRKGKDCLYDPIREILVPATPEEYVRQKVIIWLLEGLGVPQAAGSVEDCLSHYKKSRLTRADIIVKGPSGRVVLLVECKQPGVPITQDVQTQAHTYCADISPKPLYVMLTNGKTNVYQVLDGGKYIDIKGFVPYKDLLKRQGLQYKRAYFESNKPLVNRRFGILLPARHNPDIISPHLPPSQARFVANLYNCLMNESEQMKAHQFKGLRLYKDIGLRHTVFGNAGGGTFDNYFRSFLVRDAEKNVQIVSFTIMIAGTYEDGKLVGKSKERSSLVVAIDDYKAKHISLQLNLDKGLVHSGNTITVCHNGAIGVGNIGSGKRVDLLAHVKARYPELVADGQVVLGTLPERGLLHINDKQMTKFIINSIKYALVRDEFRAEMKARNKKQQ